MAKINLIRAALGFNENNASRGYKSYNYQSKGPHIKAESKQSLNRLKVSSQNELVEGGKPCERESTNQNRTHGLNLRLRKIRCKLVGALIQSQESCLNLSNTSKNPESRIELDKKMRKMAEIFTATPKSKQQQ